MDVGVDMIDIVKTNTKGSCNETIENMTNNCLGGSYLVLNIKPMMTGDRVLIYIGYKYITWKILSFIVTEDSGITKAGIPYSYKYPDPFLNVSTRPVACPLVMSKFFGFVNEVDSQNKSRLSNLALENF